MLFHSTNWCHSTFARLFFSTGHHWMKVVCGPSTRTWQLTHERFLYQCWFGQLFLKLFSLHDSTSRSRIQTCLKSHWIVVCVSLPMINIKSTMQLEVKLVNLRLILGVVGVGSGVVEDGNIKVLLVVLTFFKTFSLSPANNVLSEASATGAAMSRKGCKSCFWISVGNVDVGALVFSLHSSLTAVAIWRRFLANSAFRS